MSRRALSVVIGGGVAVIAAVCALTLVPVSVSPGRSSDVSATLEALPDYGACGVTSVTATFAYAVERPLVDVWGVARVVDATVDDVAVDVRPADNCGVESGLQGVQVFLVHPACEGYFWDGVPAGDIEGATATCGGNARMYAVRVGDGEEAAELTYDGPSEWPDSGLVTGAWCLRAEGFFSYDFEGGQAIAEAKDVGSDMCLELS